MDLLLKSGRATDGSLSGTTSGASSVDRGNTAPVSSGRRPRALLGVFFYMLSFSYFRIFGGGYYSFAVFSHGLAFGLSFVFS